jgi:hypothetical protein
MHKSEQSAPYCNPGEAYGGFTENPLFSPDLFEMTAEIITL